MKAAHIARCGKGCVQRVALADPAQRCHRRHARADETPPTFAPRPRAVERCIRHRDRQRAWWCIGKRPRVHEPDIPAPDGCCVGRRKAEICRRRTQQRLLLNPSHYEGPGNERVSPPVPLGKMGQRLQQILEQPVEQRPVNLYAALAEVAR